MTRPMWEWLAAQDIEKAANAVIILLTGLAVFMGLKKPAAEVTTKVQPAPSTMELATDFFDAQALAMLTREVTGGAVALTGATVAANNQTAALLSQVAVEKDINASLQELISVGERFLRNLEEAEERRLEREVDQLRRENAELSRRARDDGSRRS